MRRSDWLHVALLLATAPWPQMRLDQRNTARSAVPETVSSTATPWEVATIATSFPAGTELSGDGRFLHIVPDDFLEPDTDYEIRASGAYTVDDAQAGTFDDVLRFRTEPLGTAPTLEVGSERVSAFVLRRAAVPLPSLLPSLDQAGLDSRDLIAGVVSAGEPDDRGVRRVLLWVIGGRRDARGRVVPDPGGGAAFPLTGRMLGDQFILRRDDVNLRFAFGDVGVRRLELRGALDSTGASKPGTSLYAEVTCNDVPVYGPLLILTGTCNQDGTLIAGGTFLVSPFPRATRPLGVVGRVGRNRAPHGLHRRPGDRVPARAVEGRSPRRVRPARGHGRDTGADRLPRGRQGADREGQHPQDHRRRPRGHRAAQSAAGRGHDGRVPSRGPSALSLSGNRRCVIRT
ncbi:MAG: hypothetical protein WKF94_07340 [Solirubrobacteraceae bacterium]